MNSHDTGLYLLVMRLAHPVDLKAGKLPLTKMESGIYLYVGRAKRNLQARVARHIRQKKKTFWHIDYLLQHAHIESIGIRKDVFDECSTIRSLQKRIPECRNPLTRFGASDCRCSGHLLYLPEGKECLARQHSLFSFEEIKP